MSNSNLEKELDGIFSRQSLKDTKKQDHSKKDRKWLSNLPEYQVWSDMKTRCDNPNHSQQHRYSLKGIGYDPAWAEFKNFYKDMGKRPDNRYSLHRLDSDDDYTKDNCIWELRKVLIFQGQTKTISQWSKIVGISYHTIFNRLKYGWSDEETLTILPGEYKGRINPLLVEMKDRPNTFLTAYEWAKIIEKCNKHTKRLLKNLVENKEVEKKPKDERKAISRFNPFLYGYVNG